MKQTLVTLVTICLAICLVAGTAVAADVSQPSSKFSMAMGDIAVVSKAATAEDSGWQTILRTYIKTSEQKDLTMDVALQCGLFTRTLVRSKMATKDTSTAEASIAIRVVMDGTNFAMPGGEEGVIYSRRYQELSAVFQGILTNCLELVDDNGDGIPDRVVIDEECVTPEELELVLDTMDAHAFNFALGDVGSGVHKIEVQALVDDATSAQTGEAEAYATLGKGAMIVEEVRLITDADGTPTLQ